MEPSGKGFLKSPGIVLIIIAAISIIGGVFTIAGGALSASMAGSAEMQTALSQAGVEMSSAELTETMNAVIVSGVKTLVLSIINLIAGILAVRGCAKTEKAKALKIWSIIVLVVNAVNLIVSLSGGVLSVIFPILCVVMSVLMLMGAMRNQEENNAVIATGILPEETVRDAVEVVEETLEEAEQTVKNETDL